MRRQRDDGACVAYCKYSDSSFMLERGDYARLVVEWKAGKAFFDGTGLYGSPVTLKLADIVAVSDVAPEHIATKLNDDRECEREDAVHG